MAYNDDRRDYLATALGHSGVLGDLEKEWLQINIPLSGGVAEGSLSDMWLTYGKLQGYSGSMNDVISKLPYPLSGGK